LTGFLTFNTAAGTAGSLTAGLARAACLLVTGLILWGGLTNPLGSRVALLAAAPLALALTAWMLAARRPHTPDRERAWSRAGTVALVVLAAAGFVWALAFDSNQSSDFGIYYRCGTSLGAGLHDWMESCRSHYFYQPDYTYWSRALVYSAPFGLLFGDNYAAFKLYNAALHAATLALLFYGVRSLAGARAALVALLVLGLYPEWFFSVTVATPDNLAVGLIVGFLLLLPAWIRTEGARGWLITAALALVAFTGNLARTIGPFLIASLVLGALVNLHPDRWKSLLLRLAGVIVLYNIANMVLVAAIGTPVQGQFAFLQRISTIDLHEPLQNYRLVFGWLDQFLPVVPEAARGKVVWHKILTEFAQAFQNYPAYLLAKARVFSEGTGYYWYSSTDGGANPDSAITAAAFTVPTHPAMPVVLGAIVLFMACLTSVALLRVRRGPLVDTCIFFVALVCLVILGLGDTQQRYSLLIVPAMAIIAGVCLFPDAAPRAQAAAPGAASRAGGPPIARHFAWTLAGAAVIVLLYLIGSKAAAMLAQRIPRPLAEARQEGGPPLAGPGCNGTKVTALGDYKRLRVTPAGAPGCFTVWAPIPQGALSASFFLSRDEFPFPFEPRSESPYRVRVEHGGSVLWEGSLDKDVVRWYRFSLKPTAAGQANGIRFVVAPAGGTAAEPFNVWWLTPSASPLP
jgi:hypothetical protein